VKLSDIVSFTTKVVQSHEERSDERLLFSLASLGRSVALSLALPQRLPIALLFILAALVRLCFIARSPLERRLQHTVVILVIVLVIGALEGALHQ